MLDQQINYYVSSNIAGFHYIFIKRAIISIRYGNTHCTCYNKAEYEGKSYRMFTDWLVEAYYLRLFLQLSRIPHYTPLQKFTDKINIIMLGKIISSFIIFTDTRHIFTGIDATGFKITYASQNIIQIDLNREERNTLNYLLVQTSYNRSSVL